MIIAPGSAAVASMTARNMKVIMVNELTGLTAGGLYRAEVRDTLFDHTLRPPSADARGRFGSLFRQRRRRREHGEGAAPADLPARRRE